MVKTSDLFKYEVHQLRKNMTVIKRTFKVDEYIIFVFVKNIFCSQKIINFSSLVKKVDYIGLDGEVMSLPIWCSTCALIGTSGKILENIICMSVIAFIYLRIS